MKFQWKDGPYSTHEVNRLSLQVDNDLVLSEAQTLEGSAVDLSRNRGVKKRIRRRVEFFIALTNTYFVEDVLFRRVRD